MKIEDLQEMGNVATKNIKTEHDLNEFRQMLTNITVGVASNVELDDHLGYDKHEKANTGKIRIIIVGLFMIFPQGINAFLIFHYAS